MKHLILFFFYIIGLSSCTLSADRIDLAGKWTVALDSTDVGISEKWFEQSFDNEINLPGTLCDGGYGRPSSLEPAMGKEIFLNLKRKFDYVGVAWYSKEITIPEDWDGKEIKLLLERVIWDSQVWVNGEKINQGNESLVAPHEFILTEYLTSGQNRISIRIDNNKKYDISMPRNLAHAYTNETQTMWNGIIGDIALIAEDKYHIDNIAIYPDVDKSNIKVEISIGNYTDITKENILFYVKDKQGKKLPVKKLNITDKVISFDYPIDNPMLWDEFNPNIYEAFAELKSNRFESTKSTVFGMRKLTNENFLLQINGNRMFLRGTLECCIFPLEGYPPTTVKGWQKVFKAAKDYGLNHIRFHSWCPPKAAFVAADRIGIYLQVELPVWIPNIGEVPNTTRFLCDEADRIIREYGNHPSFCFWSLGNELQGNFNMLDNMVLSLKKKDNRHLYTTTTFTFEKGHGAWPEPNDDFWISQWTKKGWVRGQGIFDNYPVNFNKDYSTAIDSLPVPIITHEIGQYSVYPNLKEIEKYKGNLVPLNFMAVKSDLEKKGRLDKADDYLQASGKLAAILYKEEIERALKTPGVSGFQLLDLHDFPGQGTALVGLLDAFWESKGIIKPETFKEFCAPIVPLVRFDKATYYNDETFNATCEIANFSNEMLQNVTPVWKITDSDDKEVAGGKLGVQNILVGNAVTLGKFSAPLSSITDAQKLILTVSLENIGIRNSWEIWVYPRNLDVAFEDIVYTRNFDEADKALKNGRKVLLNPEKTDLKGLDGKFVQVFWSPVHFPNQPGTMGILCDPAHPALIGFPTEMHSNWQWWDICKSGKTMELDAFDNVKPIVTMVDNFFKNRNLGLVFEAKVSEGKLLFCSPDVGSNLEKRPVARQFLHSLVNYMNSKDFNPDYTLPFEQIEKNLKNTDKTIKKVTSVYDR